MSKARVSAWLTEVRTVHSRAESALFRLDYLESERYQGQIYAEPIDPEAADLRAALEAAVAATERFSKDAMKGGAA